MVGRDDGEALVHSTPSLNTASISSEHPAYLIRLSVARAGSIFLGP
jgi:hypothetical protein